MGRKRGVKGERKRRGRGKGGREGEGQAPKYFGVGL